MQDLNQRIELCNLKLAELDKLRATDWNEHCESQWHAIYKRLLELQNQRQIINKENSK
jgi:hypothetical protein